MVQLTRTGATVQPAPGEVEALRQSFREHHCALFRGLIEPAVIDFVASRVSQSAFEQRQDTDIARESWLPPEACAGTLHFMVNHPDFLRLVQDVTGCPRIGHFGGRIYRFAAEEGHYDTWHSDLGHGGDRLLAMSLNLSPQPFEGGALQIRRAGTEEVLFEIANTGLGNAVIFRVDPGLEHRVCPVAGAFPRTAFAGWFFAGESDFHTIVREEAASRTADAAVSQSTP